MINKDLKDVIIECKVECKEYITQKIMKAYSIGFADGQKQKEYDLIQDGKLEEEYKKGYEQGVKEGQAQRAIELIEDLKKEYWEKGYEKGNKSGYECGFVNGKKQKEEEYKKGYERGFVDGQKKKEVDFIQDLNLSGKYLIGFSKGYEQGVKDERKRIYGLIDAFADSQNEESMKLSIAPAYVKTDPDNKVTLGEATEEFIKMQSEQREEEEDPRMILCQH